MGQSLSAPRMAAQQTWSGATSRMSGASFPRHDPEEKREEALMKYWCGSCKAAQPLIPVEDHGLRRESTVVRGSCAICGAAGGSIGVYEAHIPRSAPRVPRR